MLNEKKTKEAAREAAEAAKNANDALEEAKTALSAVDELSEEELDQVAGGGNPFEDIPRVPPQPIP